MSRDYDSLWEAAWNEAASHGPGFRSRYALLLRYLHRHGAGSRLIDVGAGRGHLLENIHRNFPQLELSAVETGTQNIARLRELTTLKSVFEASESAPAGEARAESYDSVICSEVLEHVQEHGRLLDALTRLLGPQGRLFLTVPLRADLWTAVDDHVGHLRRYEHGQLAAMCRERGLRVVEDLAFGFPLYNSYYKLLAGRTPQESAQRGRDSVVHRRVGDLLTVLFRLENRFPSPLGGRGLVIAQRADPPNSTAT